MEFGRRGFQSFFALRQFRISPIIFNVSYALEDTLVVDDCNFATTVLRSRFRSSTNSEKKFKANMDYKGIL